MTTTSTSRIARWGTLWLCLGAFAVTATGCNNDKDMEDTGDVAVTSATATVGADGDTIEIDGVELEIPAGALSEDVEITVAVSSSDVEAPDGITIDGDIISFTPHGQTFDTPVTITLDAGDLTELLGVVLKLEDEDDIDWETVDGLTWNDDGTVSFDVTSFSLYTTAEMEEETSPFPDGEFGLTSGAAPDDCLAAFVEFWEPEDEDDLGYDSEVGLASELWTDAVNAGIVGETDTIATLCAGTDLAGEDVDTEATEFRVIVPGDKLSARFTAEEVDGEYILKIPASTDGGDCVIIGGYNEDSHTDVETASDEDTVGEDPNTPLLSEGVCDGTTYISDNIQFGLGPVSLYRDGETDSPNNRKVFSGAYTVTEMDDGSVIFGRNIIGIMDCLAVGHYDARYDDDEEAGEGPSSWFWFTTASDHSYDYGDLFPVDGGGCEELLRVETSDGDCEDDIVIADLCAGTDQVSPAVAEDEVIEEAMTEGEIPGPADEGEFYNVSAKFSIVEF